MPTADTSDGVWLTLLRPASSVGASRSQALQPNPKDPTTGILKVSWDLVTRVIIRVTILITPIKVVITLLTKSHDPPSIQILRRTGGPGALISGFSCLRCAADVMC